MLTLNFKSALIRFLCWIEDHRDSFKWLWWIPVPISYEVLRNGVSVCDAEGASPNKANPAWRRKQRWILLQLPHGVHSAFVGYAAIPKQHDGHVWGRRTIFVVKTKYFAVRLTDDQAVKLVLLKPLRRKWTSPRLVPDNNCQAVTFKRKGELAMYCHSNDYRVTFV